MPGLDRTGPEGGGSRTGRGMGKCNPDSRRNGTNTTSEDIRNERGFGRGKAQGRNR